MALPSLRVDAFTVGIAAELQRARRTGLTFAPEAGSWRMRQVINKLIREEDLYGAVESAYSQGWRRMKLYFLTGLPTETDEDTLGIAELGRNCVELGKKYNKSASVTVSVGGFVPKPQTPFQWFGQNTEKELRRKVELLKNDLRGTKGVQLKWHDTRASLAEGITSRGDRRLGAVIEYVWRHGGTFQEWSEHFSIDLWLEALAANGLDVEWYVYRHRTEDEVLPWDHLSAGLHKDFLWQDWRDALEELGLEDCRWTPCYDCARAPATGSNTWWHQPRRLRAEARERASTCPLAERFPSHCRPASRSESVAREVANRAQQHGKIRFTSHRDVARIWERALRRTNLPVAYSEGFTLARSSRSASLSTGHESEGSTSMSILIPNREQISICGAHHSPQCSAAGGHDRNRSGRCRPPDAVAAAGSHLVHLADRRPQR